MKRVLVAVTFYTQELLPEDWEDDSIQFYEEENHCTINHIVREAEEIEKHPHLCNICSHSSVRLVAIDNKLVASGDPDDDRAVQIFKERHR